MKKFFLTCCLIMSLLFGSIVAHAEDLRPDYLIMVNRAANCITVYQQDVNREFTIPVIAFVCSTGKNNKTLTGSFKTSSRYEWRKMDGGVYTQYATRFDGSRLFHSVPYYHQKPNQLEWDHYNRLGEQASAGCVRLSCIDAKWIYDHCKPGTQVVVYDDAENPGPLGKPTSMQIASDNPHRGWDPTDPNPANPWITVLPHLQLTTNTLGGNVLYVPAGSNLETLQSAIGLFSADGTPYLPGTYQLEVYGYYDLNQVGSYELYVRGFDLAAGLRADQSFTLIVNPISENAEVMLSSIEPIANTVDG